MKQEHLIDKVREKVKGKLNGYEYYNRLKNMDELIITPQ